MPVRWKNKKSRRAKITSSLASWTGSLEGTYSVSPSYSGRIDGLIYDFTGSFAGTFQASAQRSGVISTTLDNWTALITGTENYPAQWTDSVGNSVEVTEGNAFSYTLTATDVDGDLITFVDVDGNPIETSVYLPAGITATPQTQVGNTRDLVIAGASSLSVGAYQVDVDFGASFAEADWLARSTAPGVVWAHDFRSEAEVTAFIDTGTEGVRQMWRPRAQWVPSSGIGNSGAVRSRSWGTPILQHPSYAAGIGAPGLAEGVAGGDLTTIYVEDANQLAEIWTPELISTYPSYRLRLMMSNTEYVKVQSIDYNANTVTVYRDWNDDNLTFNTTPSTIAVGARIGTVEYGSWNRPLAAFEAGTNGKATPDYGLDPSNPQPSQPYRYKENGTSTELSWNADLSRAFTRFVGAYWGHQGHHAEFTPFVGPFRTSDQPWMGDAFYLQFRVRLPKVRFENPSDAKLLYLHNISESGPNQVIAIFKGNTAGNSPLPPPGETAPYYALGEWFTNQQAGSPSFGKVLSETQSDGAGAHVFYDRELDLTSGGTIKSAYPGATYGSGGLLNDQAWCFVPDKWMTLLFYMKPGRHNFFRQALGQLVSPLPPSIRPEDGGVLATRVEQVVVQPMPNSATINAKFPDPAAIKPATGDHPPVNGYLRGTGELGVGQAWGSYPLYVSYGSKYESMRVDAVVNNPDGTQTLTVLRNWGVYSGSGLTTTVPLGEWCEFGPRTTNIPSDSPASVYNSVHLTPYKEWHVKLWAHIEGETGYTKLIDKPDYISLHGGWRTNSTVKLNEFSFATNAPGYNSLLLQYYPNPYLGGQPVPPPTWQDFTQVILSRNFIPCPTT